MAQSAAVRAKREQNQLLRAINRQLQKVDTSLEKWQTQTRRWIERKTLLERDDALTGDVKFKDLVQKVTELETVWSAFLKTMA